MLKLYCRQIVKFCSINFSNFVVKSNEENEL